MDAPGQANPPSPPKVNDRQYRLFVESVTDYAIYLLNPDGVVTSWNAGAHRFKGYDAAEVIGRNFSIFYTPEDQVSGEPKRALATAAREGRFEGEGWRVRKDGSRFWASVVLDPIREGGQIIGYAKITRDASERKLTLDALRAAVAANQAIFDHSLDVICTITSDGLFAQVSKHAAEVWGHAAEDLIGRPYIDLVHPDDLEATLDIANQVARDGKPTRSFKNRYIHKDGSIVPIAWSAAWSKQHDAMICVARDMRDSLATEERLRQAEKLEAIGRLTGGVAHDFNNLLTVIIGGAETLLDENRGQFPILELAELIRAAGERGAELTGQLLAFARRQPLEPRVLRVNELLTGIEGMLRRTLGEDVDLRIVCGEQTWLTLADPAQLELAVLNLAINARDAMPSGGKLTLETANVTLDQTHGQPDDDIAAGDYLMVAVTDNGEGMSPETVARAFEPFFTTKPTGKGTGLGLSMAHGFVKQSNGNIKIYSALGMGTTIKLYLPRADGGATSPLPVLEDVGLPVGSEHILLVEDDDLLREHARKQLQSLGYRVTTAASGSTALERIETMGGFDLLFTDIVMPGGMNGPQLADRVRLAKPGMKVLFTSGYSQDAIIHDGRLDAGVELLGKPYRKRDLALKVRTVLDL